MLNTFFELLHFGIITHCTDRLQALPHARTSAPTDYLLKNNSLLKSNKLSLLKIISLLVIFILSPVGINAQITTHGGVALFQNGINNKWLGGVLMNSYNQSTNSSCNTYTAFNSNLENDFICTVTGTSTNHIYITASKTEPNATLAVTAADITKLQNHVLGTVLLTSPEQKLAGDMDYDGMLSAVDMLKIQRVILGYDNDYWNFVPNYALIIPAFSDQYAMVL